MDIAISRVPRSCQPQTAKQGPPWIFQSVPKPREPVKFQPPDGVNVLQPQPPGPGKTALEYNSRRTVRPLNGKQPPSSDGGPLRRTFHELLVQKEAALVAVKVGECRAASVPFYPKLQCGSAAAV